MEEPCGDPALTAAAGSGVPSVASVATSGPGASIWCSCGSAGSSGSAGLTQPSVAPVSPVASDTEGHGVGLEKHTGIEEEDGKAAAPGRTALTTSRGAKSPGTSTAPAGSVAVDPVVTAPSSPASTTAATVLPERAARPVLSAPFTPDQRAIGASLALGSVGDSPGLAGRRRR